MNFWIKSNRQSSKMSFEETEGDAKHRHYKMTKSKSIDNLISIKIEKKITP